MKDKEVFIPPGQITPKYPKQNVIQRTTEDPNNENNSPSWEDNTFDLPKTDLGYTQGWKWHSTGQMILEFQMPLTMVERLNTIYDLTQKIQSGVRLPFIIDGKPTKIFKLPNIHKSLTGKLKQQFSVYLDNEKKITGKDNHNFLPDDIHEWMKDRIHQYLIFTHTPYLGIRTSSAWINEYDAGEYSPLHIHKGSSHVYRKPFNEQVPFDMGLMGMLSLKAPADRGEEISEEEHKHRNGYVEFVGGRGQFSAESILFKYEIGQFLVFPYDMLHCAYPHFNENETRRTMPVSIDVYLQ